MVRLRYILKVEGTGHDVTECGIGEREKFWSGVRDLKFLFCYRPLGQLDEAYRPFSEYYSMNILYTIKNKIKYTKMNLQYCDL